MMIMFLFTLLLVTSLSFLLNYKDLWSLNILCYSLSSAMLLLWSFPWSFEFFFLSMYIDSMSFFLTFLSFFISILMLMGSMKIYKSSASPKFFLLSVLFLLLSLILSFSVISILSFYFFFEFSLIPTMILIMGWGAQVERVQAMVYFLMYTLFASLPLLIFILKIQNNESSFSFFELFSISASGLNSYLIWMLFWMSTGAFLVKMPMYMFHLWLPKAHVEAPVSGSMILAGVLLKLGGYGMIRMSSYVVYLLHSVSSIFMSLSIMSIFIISLSCFRCNDLKSLVAYSSVAHMGLSLTGLLTMYSLGLSGNLYMLIGHGICSSGLFMYINLVYERSASRSMLMNKGLMVYSLMLASFMFILSVINLGAPPSMNLFSELFLMSCCIAYSSYTTPLLVMGSFLVACYCIILFSSSHHGKFYSSTLLISPVNSVEYLCLYMHCLPLFISFTFMNLIS